MTDYIGGIDAGGTTFKCGLLAVGDGHPPEGRWVARERIATTGPQETVERCAAFFGRALGQSGGRQLAGLGLASFGPLGLDINVDSYGSLLATPKPGWSGFAIRRAFADALSTPVSFDTDVNAALLAEMRGGAAAGVANAAYVTIGTGIGAGLCVDGQIIGRPRHPEFGHIPIKRAPGDAGFGGVCHFHGDCLEGMASVSALKARFGDPVEWSPDHEGWDIAADYIAQACRVLSLSLCAERIVLGGGLMRSPFILPRIRARFVEQMAGYLSVTAENAAALIHTPVHGDDAGLIGATLLVRER